MHVYNNRLLPRQTTTCVVCPPPRPCNCAPTQQCFQINRDCNTCSSFKCVNQQGISAKPGSAGVSTGALVAAVIGSLVFVAAAAALFLWYRRRNRQEKSDVPAPASTVLNRPDPTEKSLSPATELSTVKLYTNASKATIDLNPESASETVAYTPTQVLTQINPFDDGHSIQTTGTDGTNVIPIALVPPGSPRSQTETLPPASPTRPARSPDLNLNLDHVNVSRDSLRATSPHSQVSGVSARQSYMSGASYASDFLNEAPMIITPTKGAIRQVLGVVKAEVIKTPSAPSTPSHSESLKPPKATRPSVGSPLAAGSFGPADMARDSMYEQDISVPGNPFSDDHSPRPSSGTLSNTADNAILGQLSRPNHGSTGMDWAAESPKLPWAQSNDDSRPSSLSTQAGSIIDIGSATRVNVGLGSSHAMITTPPSSGFPRSPYRTTMGRLVSPPTNGIAGSLEAQQQLALAHAQARAQAQGLDNDRRVSGSSVLSGASTRADSILESFPFVPPSPISDRPARSPPCSPLAQQSFNGRQPSKDPLRSNPVQGDLSPPPNRLVQGLSNASQFSTSSNGLGSFPFQIESATIQDTAAPPSAFKGRHRASLDTLALTSDLSSYPLGFEQDLRDSFAALQKN